MVNDDNLADECLCDRCGLFFRVKTHEKPRSPNLILCDTADVEPNVVPVLLGHSTLCLDRRILRPSRKGMKITLSPVIQDSRLDASNRDGPDSVIV